MKVRKDGVLETVNVAVTSPVYTEGDTDSTISGLALLGENSDELRPLQADNSDYLYVNIGDSSVVVDVAVNGSVPVTDNGGSLTVDPGSGTWDDATVTGVGSSGLPSNATYQGYSDGTNLQGARVYDTDSGAGTEYTMGVQLRGAASGGSEAIAGTAANGLEVDVTQAPARDRTTDNMGVAHQTDVIMNDTTALTPKFAVIDDAVSGNNTIVAAVVGKKIRVLSVVLIASDDVTVRFESAASGVALTGQMQLAAQVGFSSGYSPIGHFETASGSLLNLELSAAVSVDGWLVYVEV